MAEFGYLDGLDRAGSPTSIHEPRRQLQIVNTPLSPVSLDSQGDMLSGVSSGVAVNKKGGKLRNSGDVVVHTDGGRVDLDGTGMGVTNQPPAYNP
jgi:hypothetical protein